MQVSCAKVQNLMVLSKHYFIYLIKDKNVNLKCFQLCFSSFLIELTFLEPNKYYFQKFESTLHVQRTKLKFPENTGHNILELYNISLQLLLTTSKSKLCIGNVSPVAERLKTQNLRKFVNIGKMSNLGGHIGQYPVSFQQVNF